MSLASRLGGFFLAALALVLGGFSATLYLLARTHLQHDLDERLMAALDALLAAAEVEPDRIEWRPGLHPPLDDAHPGEEPVRWVAYDDRGVVVDRSGNAEHVDFSAALGVVADVVHAHLSFVDRDGVHWRLAVRRLRPARPPARAGPDADEPETTPSGREGEMTTIHSALVLATGSPLAPLQASLRHVALILVGLSSGLWLLAAVVGRRLCRRALGPVTRMAQAARTMTAADRHQRLPSPGTGDELEDLARSFNGLLGRLHEALERQKRFAGDASHQLRTPLTALLGQVEVARRRERTAEEYRRVLDQVHGEAVRLQQIVEALLFLVRSEADCGRPDLEPVDLAAWVPLHLQAWSGHPRAADLHLDALPSGPLWALVHRPLLGQLLDNLLENACKYSDPGTPIRIRLQREPGIVALIVEDRGDGLAPEDLPHLFEPFYRSSRAHRRGEPGVGLGLAVVGRIVASFGGTIAAEGEPGQGSRFVVHLPEAAREAARPTPV